MGNHHGKIKIASSQTAQPKLDLATLSPEQRMIKLQKLRTVTALQQEQITKQITSLERKKYRFWLILLVALLFWLLLTYFRVYNKWKHMIQLINTAREQGSAFDISGFFTALCLEFPFVTRFRFENIHTPYAIMMAYYSKLTKQTMGTGYDPETNIDYLSDLIKNANMCGNHAAGSCSSKSIWCATFPDQTKSACENACQDPDYGNQWLDVATKSSGWAMNFGFAGHIVGGAGGFGGPAALAGVGLGVGLGLWQHFSDKSRKKASCEEKEKNCYAPPGYSLSLIHI